MVIFFDEEFKTPQCARCSQCVSVAHKDGVVAVRNSQDDTKTTVTFNKEEWQVFIQAIKDGEFNY